MTTAAPPRRAAPPTALRGAAATITCRWEITVVIVVQAAALYVFGSLATGTNPLSPGLAAVGVFAFAAQGLCSVLNDIGDLDGDRLNHPERPLPSGRSTVAQARAVVALCLVAIAVTGALLVTSTAALAALVVHVATSLLYSAPGVRWGRHWIAGPVTLVVSTTAGIVFVLATTGLAAVAYGPALIAAIGATCALHHLLVAPLKDIHDVRGDAAVGGSSLAMALPHEVVRGIGVAGYLLPWIALVVAVHRLPALAGVPEPVAAGLTGTALVLLAAGAVTAYVLTRRPRLLAENQRACWFAELGLLFGFQLLLPVSVLVA